VTRERIAIKLKTDKIQVVPVGKTLRSGGYWEGEHPSTYRLMDVKVGDRVEICWRSRRGLLGRWRSGGSGIENSHRPSP